MRQRIDQRGDVSVGHQDVGPAVIIKVGKAASPSHWLVRIAAQARVPRDVRESLGLPIQVEAHGLISIARDQQIEIAIMIDVRKIGGHVAHGFAIQAQRCAGQQSLVFESAIVFVAIEKIGTHVIGHEEIGPAVVVIIGPHNAHTQAFVWIADARFFRHIFKRSIAAIVIENVRLTFRYRNLHLQSLVIEGIVAGLRQMMNVCVHVSRYEQIQMAVAIVICEGRAYAEAATLHMRLLGNIFESAAAKIMVKHVVTVARDIDVRQAIIVKIANGDAHAPAARR